MVAKAFLQQIEERISEITVQSQALAEEMAELERLRERYTGGPLNPKGAAPAKAVNRGDSSVKLSGTGGSGSRPTTGTGNPLRPIRVGAPFQPKEGGPTEAVIAMVLSSPGITAAALADSVARSMNSTATRPRRIISQVANKLAKKGRLSKRNGRYYPPKKTSAADGLFRTSEGASRNA